MNDELPGAWTLAPLKDFTKVEWGNTSITKKSYLPAGFPAFSATGRDGFLLHYEWEGPAVILSAIGARCGKCFPAEGKWTAIKNTIVIQGNPTIIDHKLLCYFLNDEKRWVISGTGQPFITMGTAQETMFPFPPLAEQRRIVAKLEALLGKVRSSQDRLGKIPTIIKRFRQAILAAACDGRLTADWRETRGDYEWEEGTVGDVCVDSFYGPRFARGQYVAGGIPTIRTTDFTETGEINLKDPPTVDIPHNKRKNFLLRPGDLLVTRTGSIGKMAVFGGGYDAMPSAYLIRFRFSEKVLPKFVFYCLSSPSGQELIGLGSTAVTQPNINAEAIKGLPLSHPPVAEQAEIIRRVEGLFALADQLRARYEKAKAHVDRLTQSVLAKAFRGELVPTEAELARREGREYETAKELLARIKASSEDGARPTKRPRRVKAGV